MSLIRLSLRRKRFVPVTPPPTAGLALPRGAVNGWGTAADFYDSIGINVHALGGVDAATTIMSRIASVGVRHIRDGAIPTWTTFQAAGAGRGLWVRMRTRNRALPAPSSTDMGHPIFLCAILDPWGPDLPLEVTRMHDANVSGSPGGYPTSNGAYRIAYGVDYTPAGIMQFFGGGHQHYDGNAGPTVTIPFVGQAIPNSATAPNPATFLPNPWSFADAECPWEILAVLGGPNEPNAPPAGVAAPVPGSAGVRDTNVFSTMAKQLSSWVHAVKAAKDAQTGTGYGRASTALTGPSRIVTENGLSSSAVPIPSIPASGYVTMDYDWVFNQDANKGPLGSSAQFDMSKGSPNEVDIGDLHPYQFAEEPSIERRDGSNTSGGAAGVGYANTDIPYFNSKRDVYNGSQSPSPSNARSRDANKALPMIHTEWGLVDRGQPPYDANSGVGPWPSPQDVNAEYTVRQFLLAWSWGVRRTYYYQMSSFGTAVTDNPENAFGWWNANGTIKPQGSAIKNLLRLVGFTEPSQGGRRKLNLSVTGYPTGQTNTHLRADGTTVAHRNARRLDTVQIQQDDDTWLLALIPQVTLWDQIRGNRNATDTGWLSLGNPTLGRKSPSTETVTINLPNDVTIGTAAVAWPTRNLTPNGASYTWTTPDDGVTWDSLPIATNKVTVDVGPYTKLVKLTRGPTDPAEPPQLLTVTKGPYAAGTSFATAMSGAVPGDVVGLQAGAFNWGTQTPPAGVTIQGATGGSVVNGQFTFTNDDAKLRNLTVRAVTGDTQKSVLEIDADGVEVDWCELDGTPITHTSAPKPSTVFIGGIAVQVQNVKIRRCKISGPTNADSQSHAFYIANPGPGCLIEKCWVYNFPGYGLHFNTNGSDLLAYRNVVDDSSTGRGAVFDTPSGSGPQNNTIDTCVITSNSGVNGAIHVVAGTNYASNSLLKTPGVTTPGTGTLNQSANTVVATVTYQNAAARDYRIPANNNFQFIPGPTATPVPPIPPNLPIVVPSSGSTAATLRKGTTVGPRLHVKGINIWGVPDLTTHGGGVTAGGLPFWQYQYNNRDAICATVAGWGANCIRLRVQASDYNSAPTSNTASNTKAQLLDIIENWQIAAAAQNMYTVICAWDGLDGPYATQFNNTTNILDISQFYRDMYTRFGPDPWVMYETPNEPNNSGGGAGTLTGAQWQPAIQLYIDQFRQTIGYTGVLIVDPWNWANSGGNGTGYSDTIYSALEQYDASRAGMNGVHQLVFAKHDYANNGPYNGTFSASQWQTGMGGAQIKHLIWESEFGNYNGSPASVSDSWSSSMAAAARDKFSSMQNYAGAAPFLFGPWSDANRITRNASDSGGVSNSTPSVPWGDTVKNIYFGTGSPPPAGLLTPGVVANGSTGQPEGGVIRDGPSLGADLARVEFDINRDVSVAGADRTFVDNVFTAYANVGIKILMLAAGPWFSNTVPTNTQCTNIAGWAARYGPGGAFWTGYTGTDRPISFIEFGNEESYNYKDPTVETSTAYADKAKHYASAFVTTKNAIVAGGSGVKLLAIGDASGPNFFPNWIDNMFIQVSNFSSFVDGWTVHPYGPNHNTKIQRMVDLLAGKGAPSSIPIDLTEWGVTTDNGRNLSDNYGYATNLTYAQAATTLLNQSTAMRTNANFGSRIRHFMLYEAHDNQPVGGPSIDREGYFGGRTSAGVDKAEVATAFRTILAL